MGLAKMYELIGPAGVALILVAAAGLYLTIWTVIYLIRTGRGFRSTIHEAEADGGRHFRERMSARGMYRFYGNLRRIHSCPLHPKR